MDHPFVELPEPPSQDDPAIELLRPDAGVTLSGSSSRLAYVVRGKLIVESDGSRWIVRRDRAIWLPPGTSAHLTPDVATTVVVVRLADAVDRPIGAVVVSALLRAAVQKLMTVSGRKPRLVREEHHLLAVIGDELAHLPDEPTLAPMPRDERLRALAAKLQHPDGLHMTLQACGRHAGMSARTLSRLVHQQTGLSFGRWRRRLHLAAAMSRLATGESVNSVAYATGYDSPSAFIAMFRRALGMTPLRYVEHLREQDDRTASRRGLSAIGLPLLIADGWAWLALLAG